MSSDSKADSWTKELLGVKGTSADGNLQDLEKHMKYQNHLVEILTTFSAGLTIGGITGLYGTIRMLSDKRAGRLSPTLQAYPSAVLTQRIFRGHFIRGLFASIGVYGSILLLRDIHDRFEIARNPYVMNSIPGFVGGFLMGNIKQPSLQTIGLGIGGAMAGAVYGKLTHSKQLQITLPYNDTQSL